MKTQSRVVGGLRSVSGSVTSRRTPLSDSKDHPIGPPIGSPE